MQMATFPAVEIREKWGRGPGTGPVFAFAKLRPTDVLAR